MTDFSPREIVSELDRFIIGQHDAKRAMPIDFASYTHICSNRKVTIEALR